MTFAMTLFLWIIHNHTVYDWWNFASAFHPFSPLTWRKRSAVFSNEECIAVELKLFEWFELTWHILVPPYFSPFLAAFFQNDNRLKHTFPKCQMSEDYTDQAYLFKAADCGPSGPREETFAWLGQPEMCFPPQTHAHKCVTSSFPASVSSTWSILQSTTEPAKFEFASFSNN